MGVGKSCLLLRFADDTFTESYIATIGVDFRFRTVEVDGQSVKLQIVLSNQWDTAGQERFRTITNAYYRGADGVMLVYDLTNRESFEHVDDWMEEVQKYEQHRTVKLLVGNKSDVWDSDGVRKDEARTKAAQLTLPHIETSAKSAFQVEAAFTQMARLLIQRFGKGTPREKSIHTRVVLEKEEKRMECCT